MKRHEKIETTSNPPAPESTDGGLVGDSRACGSRGSGGLFSTGSGNTSRLLCPAGQDRQPGGSEYQHRKNG